jgi:hypothetical protein
MVGETDNLVVIYDPIVQTMWDPKHLATLGVSGVCYGDSFTFCT